MRADNDFTPGSSSKKMQNDRFLEREEVSLPLSRITELSKEGIVMDVVLAQ